MTYPTPLAVHGSFQVTPSGKRPIEGKIRNTKYEKDGQTVYGTDFIADKVDYLDTKAPGGSNQE